MAGSVQALIMSFQSLLTFTYGVISIQGAKTEGLYKQAIIGFLKMPVPYALVIGIVFACPGVAAPGLYLATADVCGPIHGRDRPADARRTDH